MHWYQKFIGRRKNEVQPPRGGAEVKLRDLVPDSWSGEPLKLGKLYDVGDTERVIKATRVTPKTVTIISNNQIIGKRTIYSK